MPAIACCVVCGELASREHTIVKYNEDGESALAAIAASCARHADEVGIRLETFAELAAEHGARELLAPDRPAGDDVAGDGRKPYVTPSISRISPDDPRAVALREEIGRRKK